MSQLENSVKPILSPLVTGDARRLTMPDLAILAWWYTKVAVLMDVGDSGVLTLPERAAMKAAGCAPVGYHIRLAYWSGDVTGPIDMHWAAHGAVPVGEPPTDEPNSFSCTMRAGCVVMSLVGGPGIDNPERWRDGEQQGFSLMVWPPTPGGLSWPPAQPRLSDNEELRAFHLGFWRYLVNPAFGKPDPDQP